MSSRVLITVSPIYRLAVERLAARLRDAACEVHYLNRGDEKLAVEELVDLLEDVDVYVVGNAKVPRPVIEQSLRLRLISKYGAGVDNIDLAAAAQRGVQVTNAPGANAISVAEMTMGLLIALSRELKGLEGSLRDGGWRLIPGHELCGRTLGIVGLGNIGKHVAVRARAFGMRVLSNDIVEYPEFCRQYEVTPMALDLLLEESDLVTLHVPLTPLTRHMIGEAQLARMRRGAILIQTARGGVVKEAALYRSLADQHLAAAGIDVFEQEPLGSSPLRSLDNVILTPHVAGITYQAAERIAERTWENIRAYLAGRTPVDLIRPQD